MGWLASILTSGPARKALGLLLVALTIALLLARGERVGVLDLTDGEPTPYGSPEIRARNSSSWMGDA